MSIQDDIVTLRPNLVAFVMKMCGNMTVAEDVVQDTFVKAFGAIETFQPGSNLRAWLFTIARNTFFSGHRKGRREVLVDDWSGYEIENPVEAEQLHAIEYREVMEQIQELPKHHQDAIINVALLGLSYDEAAKASSCVVGTVKSRVWRAREALSGLPSATKRRSPSKRILAVAAIPRAIQPRRQVPRGVHIEPQSPSRIVNSLRVVARSRSVQIYLSSNGVLVKTTVLRKL